MYKVFGISNCDTVKKAKEFLEKSNVKFDFVDFKKHTPEREDIQRWMKAFGGIPVNKKGITYKKYKDEFEKLELDAQITFIQVNTSMIKRPILEDKGRVLAFGYTEEEYNKIFR